MENVLRTHVDKENMNIHTLLKGPLKEVIMDSDMTKHYVNKLFASITSNYVSVYKDIMNTFLTVHSIHDPPEEHVLWVGISMVHE